MFGAKALELNFLVSDPSMLWSTLQNFDGEPHAVEAVRVRGLPLSKRVMVMDHWKIIAFK